MTPILVTTAIAVVAGAVVAVSARDVRLVLVGLAACLLAAPLVADPLPDGPPLVARAAGSLLALEILNLAIRDRHHALRGSLLGWPTKACAAGAAAVAGYAVANGVAPDAGLLRAIGSAATAPVPMARAAGFALLALSAGSVLGGRDPLRMSMGGLLLLAGGELVRIGVVGPPTGLEQLAVAGTMIALAVAFASLATGPDSSLAGIEGATAELWPDALPDMAEARITRARIAGALIAGPSGRAVAPRSALPSSQGAEGGVARVRRPRADRDIAQLRLLDDPVPDGGRHESHVPAGPGPDGRRHESELPSLAPLAKQLPDRALLDGPGSLP